jgi:hypothetical protein
MGQMHNAGLSAGTIRDYIEFVTKGDRSTESYVAKKASKAQHTDSITGHAPDITLQEASAIINRAKVEYPAEAEPLWMLLSTGQRRVDIHRLRPTSVKLTMKGRMKFITIKWLWTKGIQKIEQRRELSFPLQGLPEPPVDFEKNLQEAMKSKKAPYECSVAKLNGVIKKMGFRATTGTFRRLFSDRIEEYCNENNIAKEDMMLHASKKMDRAFYSFNK